jgi:SAM-dependent methyltransferase
MHAAAMEWVRTYAPGEPVSVIDIGGRDVNGTVRHLFDATSYVSVDLFPGSCVDIVADFVDVLLDPVDVVICCEVAEHAENWAQIIEHAAESLRPGGRLIFTAAGPSRAPHSATDGGQVRPGEWYSNIHPAELAAVLSRHFARHDIDELGTDVRAVGWR